MKRDELVAWARRLGLGVETNSPGDGTLKYEFYVLDPTDSTGHTFLRVAGYGIGIREADTFLRGYAAGLDTAERRKEE